MLRGVSQWLLAPFHRFRQLHPLLNEARRLALRDQLYLATQLLEWVQQQVSPEAQAIASVEENPERGSIDYLMTNPLPVRNFKPLSREGIYSTLMVEPKL
ncbi:MAG: hypothetical protein HC866_11965 [Leptolyngbyaceae cyanobacterium RU_5_1]|nr:hypothetical protein [Leptolyngbyaceae cyanobacterium RU_5_1]